MLRGKLKMKIDLEKEEWRKIIHILMVDGIKVTEEHNNKSWVNVARDLSERIRITYKLWDQLWEKFEESPYNA